MPPVAYHHCQWGPFPWNSSHGVPIDDALAGQVCVGECFVTQFYNAVSQSASHRALTLAASDCIIKHSNLACGSRTRRGAGTTPQFPSQTTW